MFNLLGDQLPRLLGITITEPAAFRGLPKANSLCSVTPKTSLA